MTTTRERLRRLTTRVEPSHILAVGWLLLFLYAFPGYMSTDSFVQLQQARSGVLDDWHPPLMAWIWGWLDRVVSGPAPMLVLQITLFFAGVYRLAQRVLPARAAALATCAIALFPPVVAPMAVIWKDSQMAAFLVAGVAAARSARRRWRVAGWLLLGAAAAMRHNAAVAIVPLAMCVVWEQHAGSRLTRIGLGLAAALGVALGAAAVNHLLTDRHTYPWYNSLALHDLVGTTRWSDERSDAEMNHLLRDTGLVATTDTYARMRRAYTPDGWWWLTHGPDRIWDPPASKVQRLAIRRAWIDLVRSEPDGYWRHRRRMFNEVLGLSRRPLFSPVYRKFAEAPEQAAMLHERHSHSSYQSVVGKALTWLARGPLFRVYLYFGAAFALVALAAWKRQRLALAFVVSGITYELTYFFLAPSPDFRYSHWLVTCVVGTIVIGATAVQRARAARPAA